MHPPQGLFAQLRGFDRVFWICIFMELMERMAYYGVRLVVPVYMVLSHSDGGPGLSHTEKGTILAAWAAMQSWLPTFSGGFADRFGYKRTIAVSVVLKTLGYAGMALAGGFWTMLLGTQLLACGTGLFKPGIQGTMAHSIAKTPGRDSMGWGLFYQSVNVGAAISAYIPMITRDLYGWNSVFVACSGIVGFNLVSLLFYTDPVDERQTAPDRRGVLALLRESVVDLFSSPVLMGFILISAGFWFTFHQLFDMLPNYVDDWTDSSVLLADLGRLIGNDAWVAEAAQGVTIPQERLLNVNAILIMCTMFVFAWLSSRVHVLTSTIAGYAIASGAVLAFVYTADVYWVLFGVVVFTVGEMLSSPKKQEFLSMLAPPGKRALFLGYANMPDGIGWVLGSLLAGSQYEENGDKVNLARRFLAEQPLDGAVSRMVEASAAWDARDLAEATGRMAAHLGMPADAPAAAVLEAFAAHPQAASWLPGVLPRAEVLDFAVQAVPLLPGGLPNSTGALRAHLFELYDPGQVWLPFLGVGFASVVLMYAYSVWLRRRAAG
jgi:dipeptide/tripeptide permease